jgi:hypothetical protein
LQPRALPALAQASEQTGARGAMAKAKAKPEWDKVEAFLKRTLETPGLKLKARGKTLDSMEVYKGEDFLGVVTIDEEDGETSYFFEMAVLDIDLE